MQRFAIFAGSINAMLAVILGAFGAHGLKDRLSDAMLQVYQTGVQYHYYHSLGLILIGLVAFRITDSKALKWAAWLMLAGIILFSGSLYLLAITNVRWLGFITPFGGTSFIIAWLLLAIAALNFK